ncbi:MAG: glycosyltransferase [Nitrospiria bacterium]
MCRYSVIIPAYNEAEWLPKSIAALKHAMDTLSIPGEMIVVDNNSTDQTADVARRYGARVVFEAKNQISRARNAGAGVARGLYFIFLDADTLISSELLKKVLDDLESAACCGGGALIRFDRTCGPFARLILWFWTAVSKQGRLAAGSFIYCLRDAFGDIGGFSEAVYAGEEIFFSQALKRWGKKRGKPFRLITDYPVITSARKLSHPFKVVLATVLCVFFPFSIYFKSLCGYWYKRSA